MNAWNNALNVCVERLMRWRESVFDNPISLRDKIVFPSVKVILMRLSAPVPIVPSLKYQAVHDRYVATTYRNPAQDDRYAYDTWWTYYNSIHVL